MELIVAVDRNWAIGLNGDQLVYIPADLKHFKEITMGHPVILGRKTLATFPGGRPLKGRENLILSRNPEFAPEGARVFPDLESLLATAPEDSVVIGGESIYRALLPHCSTAYVTKIDATYEADTWFPDLDTDPDWYIAETSEDMIHENLTFRYVTYRRK